jgi:hypothetical protein
MSLRTNASKKLTYLAVARWESSGKLLATATATSLAFAATFAVSSFPATVASAVASTIATDSDVDEVVKRATLSNRPDHRRMVRTRVDRRDLVNTSRQTTRNRRAQDTVLGRVVQALEERKLVRVGNLRRRKRVDLLDHNMRVRDDDPLGVELLWGAKVVCLRVDKVTGVHVPNRHLHRESLVGRNGIQVGRRDKFAAYDSSSWISSWPLIASRSTHWAFSRQTGYHPLGPSYSFHP